MFVGVWGLASPIGSVVSHAFCLDWFLPKFLQICLDDSEIERWSCLSGHRAIQLKRAVRGVYRSWEESWVSSHLEGWGAQQPWHSAGLFDTERSQCSRTRLRASERSSCFRFCYSPPFESWRGSKALCPAAWSSRSAQSAVLEHCCSLILQAFFEISREVEKIQGKFIEEDPPTPSTPEQTFPFSIL